MRGAGAAAPPRRTSRARSGRRAAASARRARSLRRARARAAPPPRRRRSAPAAPRAENGPCVARVARDQLAQRVGHVGEERLRQAARRHRAERVAVEPRLVGGDQALLAADAQLDGAPLAQQRLDERRSASTPGEDALGDLRRASGRRPGAGRRGARRGRSPASSPSGTAGRLRRARARPGRSARAAPPGRAARAAGRGRATAPRRGARRWACRPRTCRSRRSRTAARRRTARRSGVSTSTSEISRVCSAAQQLLQAGQVEHVAQALAVGLEHDREVLVAARDLEQVLRLQPLLPQRRALARVGARDQQRARRVLAEAGAEQRRAAELGDDRLLRPPRARSSPARRPTAATRPPRRRGRAGA